MTDLELGRLRRYTDILCAEREEAKRIIVGLLLERDCECMPPEHPDQPLETCWPCLARQFLGRKENAK